MQIPDIQMEQAVHIAKVVARMVSHQEATACSG
jgi:hypothetical protein